jgi:DNA polymerase III subunit delta'
MNIKPSANTKLYGLDNYFNEIVDLYKNNQMPNKILLSGKKGLGKSTLAYHISNFILSKEEDYSYNDKTLTINEDNRSYKLIQNNSHPNFYLIDLIDEKKSIDIAQIRQMINYTNKSSFNDLPRLILIDNIENLNKNSVNALLKVVEEPNENIFFILIYDNEKKILSTLKSRCIEFKINISFNKSINISNLLIDNNVFELINYDLISYYDTPGQIINLLNFSNEKKINLKEYKLKDLLALLVDNGLYKKNKFVKELLINFIELFFLKEFNRTTEKNSLLSFYHTFLNKIKNTEKYNLDEESLFLEFKSKLLNV